ncbi:hypothetical protein AQJ23_16755 [Streptomyces antibioticus]|nr:DUF305 domain-containing protein [Streptomyces antibioticus]KUN25520.1 hypothetical protein AQJ23_16755 [Streptomyces antibioticus]
MQLRRHILTLPLAYATLWALLVVGCTAPPTTSTSPGTRVSPTAASFSPTDIAWIQLIIPMEERAQRLIDLAPARKASPRLVALAAKIEPLLRSDLQSLQRLLGASGVPDTRPHEGHDMPGMVSLATLKDAASATGERFDRIFVNALHDHLTHVGMLSSNEQTHGRASAATLLAATIAKASTRQLGWLDDARPAQATAPDSSVTTQ